jgi:hypothetical protein
MTLTKDSLQAQIPYYLTQEAKNGLLKALGDFPKKTQYYTQRYPNEVLQGDGWAKLELIRFENGQREQIKGVVLSNSCDIDPTNKRDAPPKITFAPVIKLSSYENLLLSKGMTQKQIDDRFEAIREQRVSTMFYLPKGGELGEEHVALLDDLHTLPFQIFEANTERKKLFTLSMVGFYVFVFKLSFHFCRFHENIER